MKLTGNRVDTPYGVPPITVDADALHIEVNRGEPRTGRSIVGLLSKYTDRTDLSELISRRDW